jgi:flagellar protein FliS
MMYGAKAYAQVGLESGIHSASPHGLIILLYDGAIEAIRKAMVFIDTKDIEMKVLSIDKALRIINEGLVAALDVNSGGSLAEQLLGLYDYIAKELILANIQNNTEKLNNCIELLQELRSAWQQIGQNSADPV